MDFDFNYQCQRVEQTLVIVLYYIDMMNVDDFKNIDSIPFGKIEINDLNDNFEHLFFFFPRVERNSKYTFVQTRVKYF